MNEAIGKSLKALRKNKGLSQEVVAEYLNISQSAYSRIETGESNSWSIQLEKLCDFYKITPSKLFDKIKIIPPVV
jgi:transcriptional regulator with XRE-family HTH domain